VKKEVILLRNIRRKCLRLFFRSHQTTSSLVIVYWRCSDVATMWATTIATASRK